MTVDHERLLREITDAFLGSSDFNGIPAAALTVKLGLEWPALKSELIELVRAERVGILLADTDLNPHIIRFGFEPVEVQLEKLEAADNLNHTCVYPSPQHLREVVDGTAYHDRPYTLALMMGEPQLSYRAFDLSVLEVYRSDPRYMYETNDVGGSISVRDEYFRSEHMLERDQVVLQTFGFAYDSKMRRAVAVFLRYLADLSPEHQQIWGGRELTGDFKLHPDYYRTSVLGEWGERESIFKALLIELHVINKMARAMGRPPLFRNDYGPYAEDRPREFAFLLRPTLKEFNDFILLLDKMLSDNIDRDFFRGEVLSEMEKERADGKVVVHSKGTLVMLDEWLRLNLRVADWTEWDEGFAALREVRKLRQQPAHAVDENVFDQKYFAEQRKLMVRAYKAVRTVRLLLANHPAAKGIEIPDWLYQGLIWVR